MEEYIDVYFSYNTFEADVVGEILTREGIPFILRDQRMTPYPLTIDHFPERRFAVPRSEAARARVALRYARDTGALFGDGALVEDD
jgi:hypothetical protein